MYLIDGSCVRLHPLLVQSLFWKKNNNRRNLKVFQNFSKIHAQSSLHSDSFDWRVISMWWSEITQITTSWWSRLYFWIVLNSRLEMCINWKEPCHNICFVPWKVIYIWKSHFGERGDYGIFMNLHRFAGYQHRMGLGSSQPQPALCAGGSQAPWWRTGPRTPVCRAGRGGSWPWAPGQACCPETFPPVTAAALRNARGSRKTLDFTRGSGSCVHTCTGSSVFPDEARLIQHVNYKKEHDFTWMRIIFLCSGPSVRAIAPQ